MMLPRLRGLIGLALMCVGQMPGASGAVATNDLLAQYGFDGNGGDALGRSPKFDLANTRFVHDTLFLNGNYEHGGATNGSRAVAAVSGLSYNAFTVSLDFWPVDFKSNEGKGDWLNRISFGYLGHRENCQHDTIVVGGQSYRWIGFRQLKGRFELTLNNQNVVHTFAHATVSTKRWHNLICSVDLKSRLILTVLDGQPLEKVQLPDDFNLEVIGSPEEATEQNFTFSNYSNGSTFHGYADDLKVFGRPLSVTEMVTLHASTRKERTGFEPEGGEADEVASWVAWFPLLIVGGAVAWFFRRRRRASRSAA